MVDFRYHIVSIVAVFLALGIGIIVGTTTLPRPLIANLEGNVRRLTAEKQERAVRIRQLEDAADDDQRFAEAVAPLLVGGHLRGRHVVVVATPEVPDAVRDRVDAALELAGATVTGRVRLTAELTRSERAAELDDLVTTLLPPGVQLTGSTPAQRAAAELASVLGVRLNGAAPPTAAPQATTRVLSGLAENDFVDVDGQVTAVVPAPLVLVLVPAAIDRPTPSPSPAAPDPLLALVQGLAARADGVVVAGSSDAARAGVLDAVREDGLLSARVSSVDGAETPRGAVALVLALRRALTGEHGHYGAGEGAEAPLPSPVPAARP